MPHAQTVKFVNGKTPKYKSHIFTKDPLHEIHVFAGFKSDVPPFLKPDELVLTLDTNELFTGEGYNYATTKISDVSVGGSVKDFPIPGVKDRIYIATVDPKGVYVWDEESYDYKQISNTNADGETCFISDIVPLENLDAIKQLQKNLIDFPDDKTKMKPREGRLYVDCDKGELYIWRKQITDKDEQDGGKNDKIGNLVKVGVTDDWLRNEFANFKTENSQDVSKFISKIDANEARLNVLEPRVTKAETNIVNLDLTKASKDELAKAISQVESDTSDIKQTINNFINQTFVDYKNDQEARDKAQDANAAKQKKEYDKYNDDLKAAIEALKANLYADINQVQIYDTVQVPYNTDVIPYLPKTCDIILDDGTHYEAEVTWEDNEFLPTAPPVYLQVLYGKLHTPKWMTNKRNLQPKITVIVSADPHQDAMYTTHTFILPLMQTTIKNFSKQLGMVLSNEDVFGKDYDKGSQTAPSTRTFELRLLGATYQSQSSDDIPSLIKDEDIDWTIEHSERPSKYYRDGISIPTDKDTDADVHQAETELVNCKFYSDTAHPYWNGPFTYDESTDTLSFTKMGQSTALIYMARKINNGYLPYPAKDMKVGV